MAEPPLRIQGVSRAFGGLAAVAGVDLSVARDELHALIGPNGAGKTTLMNLITGELAVDSGRIWLGGRDVTRLSVHARARLGLGRCFQLTSILPGFSLLENVALAGEARHLRLRDLWRDVMRASDRLDRAQAALEQVGLGRLAGQRAGTLAHGQKRRLELAMVLASEPSLLLLDEPMAGMGPEESLEMVDLLRVLKGSYPILLVEHDMDAVFALAERISVLVHGRLVASGDPDTVRRDAGVRRAYLGEEQPAC